MDTSVAPAKGAKEYERNQRFHEFGRSLTNRLREQKRPGNSQAPILLKEWSTGNVVTLVGIDCVAGAWQIQAKEWLECDPPQRTRWETLRDYVEVGSDSAHADVDAATQHIPAAAAELLLKAENGDVEAIKALVDRYLPPAPPQAEPAKKGKQ